MDAAVTTIRRSPEANNRTLDSLNTPPHKFIIANLT